MSLQNIWSSLAQYTDGQVHKRGIYRSAKTRLYCAIDSKRRQRFFIAEFPIEEVGRSLPTSTVGLHTDVRSFGDERNGCVSVCLYLELSDLGDLFDQMIQNLGQFVTYQTHRYADFCARIEKWIEFLRSNARVGLSRERQLGLYGELLFLRKYLIPVLGPSAALAAWSGHTSEPKDFDLSHYQFEIKSTFQDKCDVVHIANEHQLADEGKTFFLVVFTFEESKARGESLAEIIESLSFRMNVSEQAVFEQQLLSYGYSNLLKERYLEPLYELKATRIYHVEALFPRITQKNIAKGIDHVSYLLHLSVCLPFLVSESSVISLLSESVSKIG